MARPRVAFVGSGGAAKGVAHIGVLRAMQELDIEADICVGASAGASAGAFKARNIVRFKVADIDDVSFRVDGDIEQRCANAAKALNHSWR